MDLTTRVNLVQSLHSTTEKPEIPVSIAADLCGINRSSIYYSGKPVSDTELECKEIIDHLHTDHPTWGARQMAAQLKLRGYHIGRKKAFRVARPEILNSDQGCQFTSQEYKEFLKENHVRQSMDGKSCWADNIRIERWFRSFKYEEAYLTEWHNIKEARAAISNYIHNYNFERCHSAIGNVTPASVYYPAMLYEAAREAA